LLLDADALRGRAGAACHAAHVFEAVFDERHVFEVHGRVADFAHHQAPELAQVEGLAEHAHVELAAGGLEAARRQLDVLAAQGRDDVGHHEPLALEALGVDPDAHVALDGAAHHDLADAGHRLQLFFEL